MVRREREEGWPMTEEWQERRGEVEPDLRREGWPEKEGGGRRWGGFRKNASSVRVFLRGTIE